MYPEFMIAPMREELTRYGVRELRTAGRSMMHSPGPRAR